MLLKIKSFVFLLAYSIQVPIQLTPKGGLIYIALMIPGYFSHLPTEIARKPVKIVVMLLFKYLIYIFFDDINSSFFHIVLRHRYSSLYLFRFNIIPLCIHLSL